MREDAEPARAFSDDGAGQGDALFLDFDGTLVEIADHPEAVAVPDDLGPTLERLRASLRGALAIVSGRRIETIDRFLAPYRFDVAGLHGGEVRVAGRLRAAADDGVVARLVAEFRARFAGDDRIVVEDKGGSVALHWRLAPERGVEAKTVAEEAVRTAGPSYRLQVGKAVAEVLPAGATKGAAIETLMREPAFAGRRPVFVGDDLTDEHAFEAVHRMQGLSVRVGPGATVARFRLSDPAALRGHLGRWAAEGRVTLEEMIAA
jgi:trehalose 6-phosphate phosphatase